MAHPITTIFDDDVSINKLLDDGEITQDQLRDAARYHGPIDVTLSLNPATYIWIKQMHEFSFDDAPEDLEVPTLKEFFVTLLGLGAHDYYEVASMMSDEEDKELEGGEVDEDNEKFPSRDAFLYLLNLDDEDDDDDE